MISTGKKVKFKEVKGLKLRWIKGEVIGQTITNSNVVLYYIKTEEDGKLKIYRYLPESDIIEEGV